MKRAEGIRPYGSGNWTRTSDTPGMNRMLYQLSYAAVLPQKGKAYYTENRNLCQEKNLLFFNSVLFFPGSAHTIRGDGMRIWKNAVLFYLGGMGYMGLELLWRGWSHGSMFLLGGACFLLLGALHRGLLDMPLIVQAVAGAALVTALELISGLILNRWLGLGVWDYSNQRLNVLGQICPGYFFLWIWVSAGAIFLEGGLRRGLFRESWTAPALGLRP